ncbi:MAG: hypothetical protein KDJ53_06840 [Rhodobiaceae bacterium]|nr:hypothetical protein [Rhodobiaceae bacterium]
MIGKMVALELAAFLLMILFYGILLSSDFLTGKQALDALISSAVVLAAMTCGSLVSGYSYYLTVESRGQFGFKALTGIVVVATTFFAVLGLGWSVHQTVIPGDDLFFESHLLRKAIEAAGLQAVTFATSLPFLALVRMTIDHQSAISGRRVTDATFSWRFGPQSLVAKMGRRDLIADWVRQHLPGWFDPPDAD